MERETSVLATDPKQSKLTKTTTMKHTKNKTRVVLWQEETDELGKKRVVNAAVKAKVAELDAKEKEMREMKGRAEAWRTSNMEAIARVEEEERQKLAVQEAEERRMRDDWPDLDWPELEMLLGKKRLALARSLGRAWLENEYAEERKRLADREAEASIPLAVYLERSKAQREEELKAQKELEEIKKNRSPAEKRAARLEAKQRQIKELEELRSELASIYTKREMEDAELERMKLEWPDLDWPKLEKSLGKERLLKSRTLGKEWLENEFEMERQKLAEREAELMKPLLRVIGKWEPDPK